MEKLATAKVWIEKLANGINPLNDELVKEDDLINNVHISRCLFYVTELLDGIKAEKHFSFLLRILQISIFRHLME